MLIRFKIVRNLGLSFLSILFLTMPLSASRTSEIFKQLDKRYRMDKKVTGEIRYIIQKANSAGLYLPGFHGRIREGMLRGADCRVILSVVQKEYRLQMMAFKMLQKASCFSKQSHRVLTNLLYLKVNPSILKNLLTDYKKDCSYISLGSAGDFIVFMRRVGWEIEQILPLAKYIVKSKMSSTDIKGLKRLLLHSRDLRLKREVVVKIVLSGFEQGRSLRRIWNTLRENKNF